VVVNIYAEFGEVFPINCTGFLPPEILRANTDPAAQIPADPEHQFGTVIKVYVELITTLVGVRTVPVDVVKATLPDDVNTIISVGKAIMIDPD